jgi:hypothetical protein
MKIKNNFKNDYFFSYLAIFLLIFSNLSINSTNVDDLDLKLVNNNIEWHDGIFNATYGLEKQNSNGTINGYIEFGRTDLIGKIFGNWASNDKTSFGTIKANFRNKLIYGLIRTNQKASPIFFIGTISLQKNTFEVKILLPRNGFKFIQGNFQASFLPPLRGKYGIGIKDLHLIDEKRGEEFTDDPDDFREVMIRITYPIDKNISEPKSNYMDKPTFLWLKNRSPVPLFTIPDNAYEFVNPHGIINAPISEEEKNYPVIIFSPGYDGVFQIYTSLIEDLVSNGFIVVSINHPYISGITVFPDGRKVYVDPSSTGQLGLRSIVGDAKFVLDEISKLNKSESDLSGFFDLSKIGMYGHSFGGASTAICCYEDERFLCGATLDGVFYIDEMSQGLDKPFLMMLAEKRFNDENAQEMWKLLDTPAYKAEVIGSTHYAYTDVGLLLSHLVPLIPKNILGFGTIEPKRHVNITRNFERYFFEVYLKERGQQDLIDLADFYKEVNFEVK